MARTRPSNSQFAYPIKDTVNHVCPGCNNHRVSTDWEHTRIVGECKYPHVATIDWKCPSCVLRRPIGDGGHDLLPGSCRFATTRAVQTPRAQAVPRTGKHPRDASTPARQLRPEESQPASSSTDRPASPEAISLDSGQRLI